MIIKPQETINNRIKLKKKNPIKQLTTKTKTKTKIKTKKYDEPCYFSEY